MLWRRLANGIRAILLESVRWTVKELNNLWKWGNERWLRTRHALDNDTIFFVPLLCHRVAACFRENSLNTEHGKKRQLKIVGTQQAAVYRYPTLRGPATRILLLIWSLFWTMTLSASVSVWSPMWWHSGRTASALNALPNIVVLE